MKSIDLKW